MTFICECVVCDRERRLIEQRDQARALVKDLLPMAVPNDGEEGGLIKYAREKVAAWESEK